MPTKQRHQKTTATAPAFPSAHELVIRTAARPPSRAQAWTEVGNIERCSARVHRRHCWWQSPAAAMPRASRVFRVLCRYRQLTSDVIKLLECMCRSCCRQRTRKCRIGEAVCSKSIRPQILNQISIRSTKRHDPIQKRISMSRRGSTKCSGPAAC